VKTRILSYMQDLFAISIFGETIDHKRMAKIFSVLDLRSYFGTKLDYSWPCVSR